MSDSPLFSQQRVAIESRFPAWDNVAAQTQNLSLAVGQWGTPEVPAERTFLLVHGLTANMQWWQVLAQAIIATSSGPVRIIALDLRGRGDSDKPAGPYNMAVNAADIAGLLDALEIKEPINYVGHSLGAHIGTVFASSYPERVRRLTLCDGGAKLSEQAGVAVAPAINRLGLVATDYAAYVAPLKAAGIFPDWTAEVDQAYRYDCHTVEGGVTSKVSRDAIMQELEHMATYYEMVDSLYPRIQAPTTIVRAPQPVPAAKAPFLLPEQLAVMTQTIAGGAKVIGVAGTNHYSLIITPTPEVLAAIGVIA